MTGTLIVGGTVVDVDGSRDADVRVDAFGRICEVAPNLTPAAGETVADATGRLVIPGGVDAHTHLHLPVGTVRVSDDFDTGTRAAAMGGTTTIIDYVTAYRGEDPLHAALTWKGWAEPSVIDWGLHMTFTEPVSEATIARCIEAGMTSFKLYMAYPDLLQVDDRTIAEIMMATARHGGLVTLHCENGGAIEALRAQALAAGRRGVPEHSATRPAVLEGEATHRATAIAESVGAAVYIVHMSSAPALVEVRRAQERGVRVLAETCPQYLHLDVSALARPDGANFVCTPPLRDPWHREELWHGMSRGWIHTVATDHCPFWAADRAAGFAGDEAAADFTAIPGGLPGIETRMGLIWDGVAAGRITVEDWVRLCSEAPARTFGLWGTKGALRPGFDADVVVWDPQRTQSLDADALHMAVDHSPYAGRTCTGWAERVWSRGRLVADRGRFVGEPGWGRYLERGPALLEPVG